MLNAMLLTNTVKDMLKSKEEGKKEERREIAKQMLEARVPSERIQQYTGLNPTQLGKLRTELLTQT